MTLVRQSPSLSNYKVMQLSKPLQLQSSFSIHAPGEAKLFGNIVHVSTANQEVIKPGTYTIEVDQDIEKEGLQVLVEPNSLTILFLRMTKMIKIEKMLRKCMKV